MRSQWEVMGGQWEVIGGHGRSCLTTDGFEVSIPKSHDTTNKSAKLVLKEFENILPFMSLISCAKYLHLNPRSLKMHKLSLSSLNHLSHLLNINIVFIIIINIIIVIIMRINIII